jgi:L-alanine-DL-glutamate epimerase-like enolase superfamily enzyme
MLHAVGHWSSTPEAMMKIAGVEAIVLRTPAKDRRAADQTHEAALIRISSDDGHVGVGEAAAAPAVVKAFVDDPTSFAWDMGVADLLVGEDPRDPRRLWTKLYEGTVWSGRIGLGHIALAGVDMALWDLAGKVLGEPVWKLLGAPSPHPVRPYLTMYLGPTPLATTIADTTALVDRAIADGYAAAKIEALTDNTADNDEIVELVRAVRAHAGPDVTLALDVGYRWGSAEEALDCVRRLDDSGLFFLETPFMPEQVDDYRRLAAVSRTPIAAAEVLTAYAEYAPLLDAGVQVVQAGTCRLGITECDRLARAAAGMGRQFVPYGYVSTLFSVAANVQVAAANPNVPLVELAPASVYPHMILREALAGPEPAIRDGVLELPEAPGLGVELDGAALERFRVA